MSWMWISDLDGTLLHRSQGVHSQDVDALRCLGEDRVLRVLATGRGLASTRKVLPSEFPIDYLIFSSGAGIFDWKSQQLLVAHNLEAKLAAKAARTFWEHGLDFMVHDPIPETRPCVYFSTGQLNPDFSTRLEMHADCAKPWTAQWHPQPMSQVLGICPKGDPDLPYLSLKAALPELSIIRATSPVDGRSIWLEAFSAHVSKSQGAQWLADRCDVPASRCFAIGNDYNDWDLLRWAGTSFVVADSPPALLDEFEAVGPCGGAVSKATELWRQRVRRSDS